MALRSLDLKIRTPPKHQREQSGHNTRQPKPRKTQWGLNTALNQLTLLQRSTNTLKRTDRDYK